MERGSPVKLLMRTVRDEDGGGSVLPVVGLVVGGGVFTIGAFFLHPAAEIIKAAANTDMPSVLEKLRIVFLSRILD
jgi:hypothetical protein